MSFADEHGVLSHYVWFFTTKIVTAKTNNLKETSETNGRCHCGYSVHAENSSPGFETMIKSQYFDLYFSMFVYTTSPQANPK